MASFFLFGLILYKYKFYWVLEVAWMFANICSQFLGSASRFGSWWLVSFGGAINFWKSFFIDCVVSNFWIRCDLWKDGYAKSIQTDGFLQMPAEFRNSFFFWNLYIHFRALTIFSSVQFSLACFSFSASVSFSFSFRLSSAQLSSVQFQFSSLSVSVSVSVQFEFHFFMWCDKIQIDFVVQDSIP